MPASAATSAPRSLTSRTLIVMDAPPQHEDCRPFLHIAKLFEDAGTHVPHVYAQDLEQGFLLLSDLGNTTYLQALTAGQLRANLWCGHRRADQNSARLARKRIAALRRSPAAARDAPVPGVVHRQTSRCHAQRRAERQTGNCVRAHHRQQPRPAARVCASRLSLAQPDGRANRTRASSIFRMPYMARSPTTSPRCSRMPTSAGKKLKSSTG